MLLNKANSPVLRNNFRHGNQVPSYLTCLLENSFFFFLNFFFNGVFKVHRRLNVIYADRGNTKTQLIDILREREERQTLFMKTPKGVAEKLC